MYTVEWYNNTTHEMWNTLDGWISNRLDKYSFAKWWTEDQIRNHDKETGFIGQKENIRFYVVIDNN